MDSIEHDIKQLLVNSPNMRAQWKTIRDGIYANHKKDYRTLSSFGVTLDRSLKRLVNFGDINKEVAGHRSVFYFIPKNRHELVKKQLLRADVGKGFGDIWDAQTPEQRKGVVQSLIKKGTLQDLVTQQFIGNISKEFEGLMSQYISELEKPTEYHKKKYSPAEREEFIKELNGLKSEFQKLISRTKPIEKQDVGKEFKIRLELAQEFQRVVVEPVYSGKWDSAIIDLMSRAIEEQKGKSTK